MAVTDVRQVGVNFGGQDYFQSFPKLEKGGNIPKREKPNWRSTGAGEISIEETAAAEVEQQISIQDPRRESIGVEEKPREIAAEEAVTDRETPSEEEREIQEKELENLDLDDERQKLDDRSQELDHEEEDGIVSATENSVENPQKSSHDVEEERKTSTVEEDVAADGDDDYLFFGTFRTLIRRPKISTAVVDKVIIQEEREAAVELGEPSESNRVEEREVIEDEQQKSDDAENQASESIQNFVEIPQEPTTDVEEGTTQESEAEVKEGVVSVIDQIPKKLTADVEDDAAQEKDTLDNEAQELGDERDINDGEGGERKSQELEVIRQEEKKAQKIDAEGEEEETSFGGENYDDHFPKIQRKGRITKRETRGEFQI